MARSSPLTFAAKTLPITCQSTRGQIIRALSADPLYDRLRAEMKLNGMPEFHGHSRESNTNAENHRLAKNDIGKELHVATRTRNELDHYRRIIARHMASDEYHHHERTKMMVDTLHHLAEAMVDRLIDLFHVENMLYNDNPHRDNLPHAFCDAVDRAKYFNAQARGGMLKCHTYMRNHGLEDGGSDGELREPPPLKEKKKIGKTIAGMPKALVRKMTGL